MDVSAVVLNKLLSEQSLDLWAKLKLVYLDAAYSSLYSSINKYYEKYNLLPSFDDLELTLREGQTAKTLATIKLTDMPEVTHEVALDALVDQYTQAETVKLLDKFVDKLPQYDTSEIKEELANIALTIEEKTASNEKVFTQLDLMLFQAPEDTEKERVYLGFNNAFDAALSGMAREEVLFIGGRRGAGKSIVGSNIFTNQYENGMTSIYFTIEMKAREVNDRNMAILAGVSHQNIKQNKLTDEEVLKLVNVRANMFTNGEEFAHEFLRHRDRYKFEHDLVRNCRLKEDNQMIIVDDRELTIGAIDLHIGKAKARFGDKLGVAVVDYINQIVIEGGSQYDWQPQIEIAKKLKNIARKHNIVLVSPYQIDASGEARFAKGILDSADIALTLEAHDKDHQAISFDTTKIRGGKEMSFTCPIDWDTLRIHPQTIDRPQKAETVKKAGKSKKSDDSGPQEPATDLAWNA